MVSKPSGKENASDGADVDADLVTFRKTVRYLSFSQHKSKRSSRTKAVQIAQRIKSRQNNNSDSPMNLRCSTRKRRVVHHDDYTDSSGSDSEDDDLLSSKYRRFRSQNNSSVRHKEFMPLREGLRPCHRDADIDVGVADSVKNLRLPTLIRRTVHLDDYTDSSRSEDNELLSSKYRSSTSRNNSNIRHRVSMPPCEGLRPRGRDAGSRGILGLVSEDKQDAYKENNGPENGNEMKGNDGESKEGGAEGDGVEEEEDGKEETDGKRKHDLINRADVRRLSIEEGKQRPRSPIEGGHQGDVMASLASGVQTAGPSSKGGADIQPLLVDESVSFDDVGGLTGYIDALKDMVKMNRKNMVSKQSGKENASAVVGADADADVEAGVVTSPFLKRTSDRINKRTKSYSRYSTYSSKRNKTKTRTTAVQIAQKIKSRQNNNSDSPMNRRVVTRKRRAVHHDDYTDSSGSEDNDLKYLMNRNSRSRNDSNVRHKDKIPSREGLRPAVASTSNSQSKEKTYTQSQVDAMFAAQNSLTESIFNALRAANIAIPEFRPIVPQKFGPG